MSKSISCALFIICLIVASTASAGDYYVSGKVGGSFQAIQDAKITNYDVLNDPEGTSFTGSLGLGYNWNDDVPVRTELELGYRQFEDDVSARPSGGGAVVSGKYTSRIATLMANAYWDFYNKTKFTPYLGAGLGVAAIDTKVSDSSGSVDNILATYALNVSAGCGYEVSDNVILDLGYRYLRTGEASVESKATGNKMTGTPEAHEVTVGLRYEF